MVCLPRLGNGVARLECIVHLSYKRGSVPVVKQLSTAFPPRRIRRSLNDALAACGMPGRQRGATPLGDARLLFITGRAEQRFIDDRAGALLCSSGEHTLRERHVSRCWSTPSNGFQLHWSKSSRILIWLPTDVLLLWERQSVHGNGFADFLLGLPDFYSQQSSQLFMRARDGGAFGDSGGSGQCHHQLWLRWDYITPWAESTTKFTTFVQGVPSKTFPGAPLGYLVRGTLCDGDRIRRPLGSRLG